MDWFLQTTIISAAGTILTATWKGWTAMLRLPEKTPLPQTVSRLLEDKNSKRLIQVPGEKPGEMHAFLCQSLTSLDGSTLLLSLDRERTPLGRGLVRSLWFDRPAASGSAKTVRPGKRRPGPTDAISSARLLRRCVPWLRRKILRMKSPAPGSWPRKAGQRQRKSFRFQRRFPADL